MPVLLLRFDEVSASDVDLVGGKGANLGELARAHFPVPDGCILTTHAYAAAAEAAGVDPRYPAAAAERLRSIPVPVPIAAVIRAAYADLGGGPVAVRSSATAEDLPGASFAGQQDTYLNVQGPEAVLEAVQRCWASLWNDRAVAYRGAKQIDEARVRLAVVVQKMVPASAAGVLFTADPVIGRRGQAAIDAIADLGEKLVSGAVDPDHYVIDAPRGAIIERRPMGVRPVLDDRELLELAALGARVERHFGEPQDIEFALDRDRRIWLVQSRPITTLYPLPADARSRDGGLRVYFSANVFQGYFEPLTPMGIQFFRLIGTSAWRVFGARVDDAASGPPLLVDAGMRLFLDLTPVIRDALGRQLLVSFTGIGEARSSVVLSRLASDPRLMLVNDSRARSLLRVVWAVVRAGVVRYALRVLRAPKVERARLEREMEAIAMVNLSPDADAAARLDAVELLLLVAPIQLFPRLLGMMAAAMLSLGLATALLRGRARGDELQTLTRGAPNNPTTEMDLALWSLGVQLRSNATCRAALLQSDPGVLAATYRAGTLPAPVQTGVSTFLARYGFRSIGEIDIGVPRWSEDPTHILGVLANYVRLDESALAPDAQFARGQHEAAAMATSLLARVHGPRRLLLRFVLRRMRELIGAREAPKFHIIRLLATPARELLRPVGAQLAAQGLLSTADDVFFLSLPEARRAVSGEDLRGVVASRRQAFETERTRRHLPRVLLSDGTDAEAALASASDAIDPVATFVSPAPGAEAAPDARAALRGSPASPGRVSGTARVILSPRGARLEPGEILVAPSTDPGWTPLFLTAGGLVMEMGGMMSHGAVVAREYGIPAVVGVAHATERIATGQHLTVDGSAGTVVLGR